MTNYSLRARMMILILAPTVLIGLLLSIFFVAHRYNDLQRQLEDAGASIIEPLAVSSEYGMNLQNRESIGQLISVLHRRHSEIVRAISVYDSHNRLFVTSNYQLNPSELQIPKGEAFPRHLSVIRDGDMMILRTPIVSESYSPDESPESDAKMPGNMLGYVALELDLKSVRLQQYKEIFISSVMMLFCIGIALIFGWRLMRDVTGPIRNMVNTVDRIRRGQLDSRVEGFMLGELDMLKNGINSMAMSLAAYHEEMQHNVDQATSDLRETLEQMEIQNVELDLAKKRAQEAARIKSEFLANMSHELRTPLNGVIGFTRLTLKTDLNATQRDHLTTIERSANNLLAIINDVLDFSKLEAGKLILESIPFLLRTSLDEVVTLLAHSAHDKGLELTLNIKNNVPDNVIGDPLRLQQIVTNLVGNAIKFTEHGNIDVLVEQRAISNSRVQIEIQIHDTGIGIPERDQSRLFQAFRQADASISRRHGGTGLGLVITQRLVKEMGGDISFHSQPNRGSTFWFHISLDLNPNAIPDTLNTDGLVGKRLAYVEANATAAQCTLEMLAATPLEVIYSPTFSSLAEAQYDILLVGIPVSMRDLSPHREKEVMSAGIERGITTEGVLPGKLRVPRRAAALRRMLVSQDTTNSDPMAVVDWINMFALAVNEENAAGGRVVTAPTNGACGIVPAVLAYYDKFIRKVNSNSLARYMLVASAIGSLYKMNASISGAEVGCQGEVGVACSMAAAGLAELLGGSPGQVCIAAEIAMEHNLGLTCDPVAGQVQVPCIERNAIAAVKAVNAARMALRRTSEPRVCLDKVIETMYETGKDMNAKYRETSRGGLAMKIVACD